MSQKLSAALGSFTDGVTWLAQGRAPSTVFLPLAARVAVQDHRIVGSELPHIMGGVWRSSFGNGSSSPVFNVVRELGLIGECSYSLCGCGLFQPLPFLGGFRLDRR